jgi:alcohol-forming fatty acyl-CoA reductase
LLTLLRVVFSVLEKLLRELGDDVGHIYVLIRNKERTVRQASTSASVSPVGSVSVGVAERLKEEILSSSLFDTLRGEDAAKFEAFFVRHVTAVSGDLALPTLLERDVDVALLRERVQIVIHCAASVTFTSPLHEAIVKNVTGALGVFSFAATLPLLDSYCHVSTAYVNCNKLGAISETLPTIELPEGVTSYEAYYKQLTSLSEKALADRSKELVGAYPNTYCFSKALAERVLVERARGYPLCIVRPTIVGGAAIEPVPGWTDSVNAVGAVTMFIGLGVLQTLYGKCIVVPDVVPVDLVVGAILAAVPYVAGQRDTPPLIVHAGSHKDAYTWGHHGHWIVAFYREHPMQRAVGAVNFSWMRSALMYRVYLGIVYKLPLAVLETYLSILPNKSLARTCATLRKVTTGIVNNSVTFRHFLNHEWVFDTANLMRAWASLDAADRARVHVSPNDYDIRKYVLDFAGGIGALVDKKRVAAVASEELRSGAAFSEEALTSQNTLYCQAVELQDYIDSLLTFLPPSVYLGVRAVAGASPSPRNERLARVWLAAGAVTYGVKRVLRARGIAERVRRGQPHGRAVLFERLELPMLGWFLPLGVSLLAALQRRWSGGRKTAAGLVLHGGASSGLLLRLARWLVTFGGSPLSTPFWIAVLSYVAFNFVESAAQLGARPVRWKHLIVELPAWRKTIAFVSFVALIRFGRGRETQGMQEWLRMWERGA